MNLGESYAGRMSWVEKNLANNLDFLPDDKLNWKPSPTANSALEIMDHLVAVIQFQTANIRGDENVRFAQLHFTTRDEAKAALHDAAREYSQVVRAMKDDDWNREITLPFGTFSAMMLGEIAVSDAMHHHGQIVYLQTLLGDNENHLLL